MTNISSAADYRDYLHRYGLKNTRHRQLILQLLLASERADGRGYLSAAV